MSHKNENGINFSVQLRWISDSIGHLTAKEIPEVLRVATPLEFGGPGKIWTPEHFFLHAISGCFMTTYLSFSRKLGFEIADFKCETTGQIEIVEGKYKFTQINLFPKVYIADERLREKAEKAMEKTHKYCLITNSVNAEVFYHGEVFLKSETGVFQTISKES